MRISLISAAVVVFCAAALAVLELGAQQPPVARGPAPGAGVAVIDIAYIFKNSPKYKLQQEQIKADAEAADRAFRAESAEINKQVELLKSPTYKPGTPPYKQLEEQIFKRKQDLSTQAQIRRKEFVERDAKINFNFYREVSDEVKYYCERNGYALVLSYSNEPVDSSNPKAVVGLLSNPVVYQGNVDITLIISDSLNRRGAGAGANPTTTRAPQRPTTTPPR